MDIKLNGTALREFAHFVGLAFQNNDTSTFQKKVQELLEINIPLILDNYSEWYPIRNNSNIITTHKDSDHGYLSYEIGDYVEMISYSNHLISVTKDDYHGILSINGYRGSISKIQDNSVFLCIEDVLDTSSYLSYRIDYNKSSYSTSLGHLGLEYHSESNIDVPLWKEASYIF